MLRQQIPVNGVIHELRYYRAAPTIERYELTAPDGRIGSCKREWNARHKRFVHELSGDVELAQVAKSYFK